MVLLVAAGLLFQSFAAVRELDPGVRTAHVLTLHFSLSPDSYSSEEQVTSFYERMLKDASALPGVQSAGITTALPLTGDATNNTFLIEGRPPLPPGHSLVATLRFASPGYFATVGVPLKSGRVFSPAERGRQARQAVVSEAFATRYFAGANPLGQRLRVNRESFEIVGVVGSVRADASSDPEEAMFLPILSGQSADAYLTLRGEGDALALALPAQRTVAHLDPDLPFDHILTMEQVVARSQFGYRSGMIAMTALALLATLLATVGIYGVIACTTTQRKGEFGIRVAVGANRSDLLWLVVSQGMRPVIAGILVGAMLALQATRFLSPLLYGVRQQTDAEVVVMVALLLCLVSAAACLPPAWRASHVDPILSLRAQ